jgi:hypothetical protein
VGERVCISLEYHHNTERQHNNQYRHWSHQQQGMSVDMEDMMHISTDQHQHQHQNQEEASRAGAVWDVTCVDPNTCAGTIETASDTCITLLVHKLPKRLRVLLGASSISSGTSSGTTRVGAGTQLPLNFTLRVDKDVNFSGVSALRSNLLRMCASPHNPFAFREVVGALPRLERAAMDDPGLDGQGQMRCATLAPAPHH